MFVFFFQVTTLGEKRFSLVRDYMLGGRTGLRIVIPPVVGPDTLILIQNNITFRDISNKDEILFYFYHVIYRIRMTIVYDFYYT